MLFEPKPGAEMMPAVWLSPAARSRLLDGAHRLAVAMRALGYRGNLSGDAIVTGNDDVLFTEYNGRLTSSTHIHDAIGRRVVGPGYARDRVLHDCLGWVVPSYQQALTALAEAGLAYRADSRCGVILCSAFNPRRNRIMFCVVAPDPDAARDQAAAVRA